MSAKIIHSHRYKKTTRAKANQKKEQKYEYFNQKRKKQLKLNKEKQKKKNRLESKKQKVENILEPKKITSTKIYIPTFFKVACLLFCLVLIGIVSKKIVDTGNIDIIEAFRNGNDIQKEQEYLVDYSLKVGLTNLDTTDMASSKNIILKDLEKLTKNALISVNQDYSITYLAAKTIDKISNKEYNILLNDKYKMTPQNVIDAIEAIKSLGESSIYYSAFSQIESMEILSSQQLKIRLNTENPYFVYHLDFPISSEDETYFTVAQTSTDEVLFQSANASLPISQIAFKNYTDSDKMVEEFRNNQLDIFFTSSNNAMQLIGKHEYSVKKYRNGETIFILGNKESDLFSRKEIRQALVYSLNREKIVEDVNAVYGERIDLPFIYSGIQYKYDIYGAQNVMLSHSWEKNKAGIYEKEGVKASLKLLLNGDDENKVKIAENIKQMCEITGIQIEIIIANSENIMEMVNAKNYDIVLADITVSHIPDITYLREYIDLNDTTKQAFLQVETSSIQDLPQNITNLENVLSSEVVCIGVFARNINMVYQKDIAGFENIAYFKIFDKIGKIGKIKQN